MTAQEILARRTAGRCQACYGRMTQVGDGHDRHPSCGDDAAAEQIRAGYEKWRLTVIGRELHDQPNRSKGAPA